MISVKRLFLLGGAAIVAALLLFTFSSCEDIIYDDLKSCKEGLSIRFIYDYNMEYANAFSSHIDCLRLYVYDSKGELVKVKDEVSSVLKDENYRMELDLPKGDYHLIAYGGIACQKASFKEVEILDTGSSIDELKTTLNYSNNESNNDLHGFYFGSLDVSVKGSSLEYTDAIIYLKKNTNNIRIILSGLEKEDLASDFEFTLTANNTLFDNENNIISSESITYRPWDSGGYQIYDSETKTDSYFITAEISTSRLMEDDNPRLKVISKANEKEIINISLIDYLLLLRSNHYSYMSPQEYLDREDNWTMVFPLFRDEENNLSFISSSVTINDWVVRLNDVPL